MFYSICNQFGIGKHSYWIAVILNLGIYIDAEDSKTISAKMHKSVGK